MKPINPLQAEVTEYTIAEIARVGAENVDMPAIVKSFMPRGISRATAYRWVQHAIADTASGHLPPRPTSRSKTAPPGPEEIKGRAASAAAAEAADTLIRMPTSAEVRALEQSKRPALAVMDQIRELVKTCNKVLSAAMTKEGEVRNPRMMLQASEHLRRIMETAAKVSESINNTAKVERFMQEVVAAMRQASPETAHILVDRLTQVFDRWDG